MKKCTLCESDVKDNVCVRCGKKFVAEKDKTPEDWPPPEGGYGLEGCAG